MSEKTEEPTPGRLRKAREQGDSPISQPLTQSLSFIVAVALAPAAIAATLARVAELLPAAIREPPGAPSGIALGVATEVVTLSAPLVLGAALAAAATGAVQAGGFVAWKKLGPDFSKLNPAKGLGSLLSRERMFGIVRALAASLLIAYLASRLLAARAADIAASVGEPAKGTLVAGHLLGRLAWIAALVGVALAAVDVLFVRQSWLRRNRMSPDEIKREHKESEGDPELKGARHRAHQEMLASASVNAVQKASVLIVNPTHLAAALHYEEEGDSAPRVVAQGSGELARKMIAAAHAYGVPVVRDVPIAQALMDLEVGDEIPEALYEAVAEILREAWADAKAETEPQT
ncbi:MAG: EscU/YscU/HrcU family type III secretion system export apparatus switch protein [Myxococcales bacterium]|nr:EscU/YscU/HrcU family type III secretion system export apparatus switch protein [Myxococcales bacterium]